MMRDIAIVGIGRTPCEGKKGDKSLNEIIFEAARAALEDAGIERDSVDNIVIAGSDQLDGRAISSMVLACPAGAYLKDEMKVCEDGATAVAMACMRLASGIFNISLVVSWTKCSEAPILQVSNLGCEPFFNRPIGLNYVSATALQAQVYADAYGVTPLDAGKVVVKNRSNGALNPFAHLRQPVGMEEIKESSMVAWPLRSLDLPPESDGACAMVMVSSEKAKDFKQEPVWVSGIGWFMDSYYLGSRDLSFIASLKNASNMAYEMAGIENPVDEIDLIEMQEISAYHELMNYEGLGLCERGKGKKLVNDGITSVEGACPVNVSGGALCSNPVFCGGLIGVSEAAMQIRGGTSFGPERPVKKALAHGTYGFCGQGNTVVILQGS